MDENSEMAPHIDSALSDLQQTIRDPYRKLDDYDVPVYHVTHDDPDPHQTFPHEKSRAPMPRHEIYPELLRKYEEERGKQVAPPAEEDFHNIPVYHVTHDEEPTGIIEPEPVPEPESVPEPEPEENDEKFLNTK